MDCRYLWCVAAIYGGSCSINGGVGGQTLALTDSRSTFFDQRWYFDLRCAPRRATLRRATPRRVALRRDTLRRATLLCSHALMLPYLVRCYCIVPAKSHAAKSHASLREEPRGERDGTRQCVARDTE
eukprot:2425442-Rhodomonas_salina.1